MQRASPSIWCAVSRFLPCIVLLNDGGLVFAWDRIEAYLKLSHAQYMSDRSYYLRLHTCMCSVCKQPK